MANKKPLRMLLAGGMASVALLLVIGLVLSIVASRPEDAARGIMAAKGWRQEQLSLLSIKTSDGPFGGRAHVEFGAQGLGTPKVIRVDLVRPACSPNWRVSAYHESISKRE